MHHLFWSGGQLCVVCVIRQCVAPVCVVCVVRQCVAYSSGFSGCPLGPTAVFLAGVSSTLDLLEGQPPACWPFWTRSGPVLSPFCSRPPGPVLSLSPLLERQPACSA